MNEINLGKVKETDEKIKKLILEFNGGVRLGVDADGKPGYYKHNEGEGADTVIPFSQGGGGIKEADILYTTSYSAKTSATTWTKEFEFGGIEKEYKNILALFLYSVDSTSNNIGGMNISELNGNMEIYKNGFNVIGSSSGIGYSFGRVEQGKAIKFKIAATLRNMTSATKYFHFILFGLN